MSTVSALVSLSDTENQGGSKGQGNEGILCYKFASGVCFCMLGSCLHSSTAQTTPARSGQLGLQIQEQVSTMVLQLEQ